MGRGLFVGFKRPGSRVKCGQSLRAIAVGIALRTPNLRAG
jgi:hypothetical protein